MTVTVDAATENLRTDTTSPQTFQHVAAGSGVKGVVVILLTAQDSTDNISACSYGGQALTRSQRNQDTAGELGGSEIWFLGSGIPQGEQTVSYTPGAAGADIHATVITLLAGANLEVIDSDGVSEDAASPSVTLQYGGRSAMAFAGQWGGSSTETAFTPNANCTTIHSVAFGTSHGISLRQTTAGTADFAIGGTSGFHANAYSAIAVSEAASSFNPAWARNSNVMVQT